MRRLRGLAFFTSTALCGTIACGGTEFLASSGDAGVSSDGGPLVDATVPSVDGGPGSEKDAADAGAPDGNIGSSTDAGDSGDASLPPFTCATSAGATVLFCSDFDQSTTPPWNWAIPLATAKGTDAVDTTDFVSPPNGYAASNTALLPGDTATFASLQQTLTSTAAHLDYAFQVILKKDDATGATSFPIARLVLDSQNDTGALFLDVVLAGTALTLTQTGYPTDAGTPMQTDPITGSLTKSTWVRVEMLVDRSATQETVTVLIDGVVGLDAQPLISSPATGSLEVDLGILDVVPPSPANALTFDNVIVHAY